MAQTPSTATRRPIVDTLNAGLFPDNTGESHTFVVRNTAGATRTVTMTSANITHVPVPIVTTFNTASGQVGYIQFNDHIATAETPLKNAITLLDNANVTDLILDLRYNGGGYLDIASELAYMIANTTLTSWPHVREDRVQRQESESQSGDRRNPDADAVPFDDAGLRRRQRPRASPCRR